MGTITINIDDDTESRFRSFIYKEYGKSKGVLGRAVSKALEKWLKEKKQEEIAKEALSDLKKGFNSGGFRVKSREELHER